MIYLDMDGPIARMTEEALGLHGREDLLATWPAGTYFLHEALGLTEAEAWKPIVESGVSFWADLPEQPWASELVRLALSIDEVMIASSPTASHYSLSGKAIWLERHFGGRLAGPDNYMLGRRKERLAEPGSILIDDHDENVRRFRERGGLAVLVPFRWNSMNSPEFDDPVRKFVYVRDRLRQLRGA